MESGKICQFVIDGWLCEVFIYQVPGLPQLFVYQNSLSFIQLALCKVVDDILVTGSRQVIERFFNALSKRFKVGRVHIDPEVILNGIRIKRNSSSDRNYDLEEYFNSIHQIDIPPHRRKKHNYACIEAESLEFLSLTGSLNWRGHGVLSQASFAVSFLQKLLSNLTVSSLITPNKMLQEIKKLMPSATMPELSDFSDPCYLVFSDAIQGMSSYGQTW